MVFVSLPEVYWSQFHWRRGYVGFSDWLVKTMLACAIHEEENDVMKSKINTWEEAMHMIICMYHVWSCPGPDRNRRMPWREGPVCVSGLVLDQKVRVSQSTWSQSGLACVVDRQLSQSDQPALEPEWFSEIMQPQGWSARISVRFKSPPFVSSFFCPKCHPTPILHQIRRQVVISGVKGG